MTKHAVDGGARDAVALRQRAETLPLAAVAQDTGPIEIQRFPPDVASFEPGAAHAGTHPLNDQIALQLGDRSD